MASNRTHSLVLNRAIDLHEEQPLYYYLYGKKDPQPDLIAIGYLRVAQPYIKSITFETVAFGQQGAMLYAAVKCRVVLDIDGREIVAEDFGEANSGETKVFERGAYYRFAATRAKKRALATALGIDKFDIGGIMNNKITRIEEEEPGTPLDDNEPAKDLPSPVAVESRKPGKIAVAKGKPEEGFSERRAENLSKALDW